MEYDCCELAMLMRLGMVTDACCIKFTLAAARYPQIQHLQIHHHLIPGVFNNMRCDDMLYNLVTLTLLPCSKS